MQSLQGRQVLVVEDEYLIADDLRYALEGAGAAVLGPVADVAGAFGLIDGGDRIDAVLLDINLNGRSAFPVADALIARDIPVAFATGYDDGAIPERFAAVVCIEKPSKGQQIVEMLSSLLAERPFIPA